MMTVLYILLFLLFLSILIVIHELGHLTAAKIFKIYCMEFSIGLGPAIIHHKGEGKETYFSLRIIPFGGYVSMYGEAAQLPEGEEIPISRSLEGIRKWKRAIIMAAGVIMNAVLALVIFYISNQACVHYSYYLRYISPIPEASLAAQAGVTSEDPLYLTQVLTNEGKGSNIYEYCVDAVLTYEGGTQVQDVGYAMNTSKFTMDIRGFEDICGFYQTYIPEREGATRTCDISKPISLSDTRDGKKLVSVQFTVANCKIKYDEETKQNIYDLDTYSPHVISGTIDSTTGKFTVPLGLEMLREDVWYDYPTAVKQTFVDFGNASIALFKGLGSLFTPEGWKNVGGIIAIGVTTTSTLTNQGIAMFLYYWGFISINLAIVNLLPFPGLDGWHLLVIAVEGISRKKIPNKVKNIVSMIGISLLFVLMVLIVIKDIIALV